MMATEILGLAATVVGETAGVCTLTVKPYFYSAVEHKIQALVIKSITTQQPPTPMPAEQWPHLDNLRFADPKFHTPGEIDLLFGSGIFWKIFKGEKLQGTSSQPMAVNTEFGWIVAGDHITTTDSNPVSLLTNIQLDQQQQRSWKQEEIIGKEELTPEEQKCKEHYKSTVQRLSNGRFAVSMPWKESKKLIGESRSQPLRRLQTMETKLNQPKNAEQKGENIKFMREYEEMGHMSQVPVLQLQSSSQLQYYIPHHMVQKADSTTTKFRVVFDGSALSSSGVSINSAMMVGPVVQSSLFEIILRFRLNRIAFTSDIAKMNRKILLKDEDRDMHKILWREEPSHQLKEYKLNTVTYGTSSAPYLATRTLTHLAEVERNNYPVASQLVKRDCYVDDLMSGMDSEEVAIIAIQQIIKLGNTAGFSFRKWSCSNSNVLNSIPVEVRETNSIVPVDEQQLLKTLGMIWNTRLELTTAAFMAAFRRFMSRRGRPSHIYSECGTIFVGADKKLKEIFQLQEESRDEKQVAEEGISWKFNPAGSPHFNSMAELGVKGIKYHLRRVMGTSLLNLEEFNTLIIQIEGTLNSRPITPISTDPNDFRVLTPGHFLIGEAITALPDQNLCDLNVNRLDRWQLLQQTQQAFWRHWSLEFISRMQQRPKWLQQQRSLQINGVVIIRDETLPPAKWRIGRIVEVHPGPDGLVRVASIKTERGIIKRCINKLCVLWELEGD